jgi:hypothetical protein
VLCLLSRKGLATGEVGEEVGGSGEKRNISQAPTVSQELCTRAFYNHIPFNPGGQQSSYQVS